MVFSQDDIRGIIGATAYDPDGDKLGRIGQVYYDDESDQPRWVTVNTGLFGTHESFVPLGGASVSGDRVTLRYDKARIKDAPNVAADGDLSVEEERRLFAYYDADHGDQGVRAGGRRSAGHDTSGPNTDDAMTRSEERLTVGTETREAGRARLRKHVVTEHEQVTVPVAHEEVVLEREPITDANRDAAYDGPAISEDEHEVVLTEQRPVVDKEAVPVERVRLGTETVRGSETVGGEVRKEQIEFDDEDSNRRR
jgi:uncharacterized protein (TIGR02271 family)